MDYLIKLGIDEKTVEIIQKKYSKESLSMFDIEQNNVIENIKYLKKLGVKRIDEILISHLDLFTRKKAFLREIFNNYNVDELVKEINKNFYIINYI